MRTMTDADHTSTGSTEHTDDTRFTWTTEQIHEFLKNNDKVEVVEADLNPEDPRLGRCQFLIHVVDEAVMSILDGSNADYAASRFGHGSAYNVGLPPKQT